MTDADPKGHVAPGAIAEQVGPLDRALSEKRSGAVRHLLEGYRTINVGRVPVPLLLNGDYLSSLREGRQNFSE